MIYSDEENFRWWKGLTKSDQEDLLIRMHDNANSSGYASFASSLQDQWRNNVTLTAKQVAAIRKWDR